MNTKVKEVIKEDPKKVVCHFCHMSLVNALELGPLYHLDGISVHYFCILFSAGLSQNGDDDEGIMGFLPADLLKEIKRGNKLKCKYCRKWNATIGCWDGHCQTSYHYPCGLKNECAFQFIGSYKSHCPKHKEKNEIPQDTILELDRCPICLCDISKEDKGTVWPPCCRKGVLLHKRCVMEMGRSHGLHFFKCPLCNDKDIFSVAMRKAGIYLPDRDAAWETEPGAYQEHRQQYKRCDAEKCSCPKGRNHSSKTDSKPWKIIRCGGCGASAIHKLCGNLKNLTWRCVTCSEILSGKRKSGEVNTSRIQRPQYETFTEASGLDRVVLDNPALEADKDVPSALPPQAQSNEMASNREISVDIHSDNASSEDDKRKVFDPRIAMTFDFDNYEDSGSTEDEEDDDCIILISPDSNVYKDYLVRLPRTNIPEISTTASLRRSSEEVKYEIPVSTTFKTLNSCPVLPSRSKLPVEAADKEQGKKSVNCQLEPSTSSSSSAAFHEVNFQSENILVENENNNDDDMGLCILNCYSTALDSVEVKAEEKETPEDKTNQCPNQENQPSSNKEDEVEMNVVVIESPKGSQTAVKSTDLESSDSDLEIVGDIKKASASQRPAILGLLKGKREGKSAVSKNGAFANNLESTPREPEIVELDSSDEDHSIEPGHSGKRRRED